MSDLKIERIVIPPDSPIWQCEMEGPPLAWAVKHQGREFSVMMTRDLLQGHDARWHISIAGRDRKVPGWNTVAAVAHEIRPGVPFVLGVPPKSWWMNIHPGALHLHETKDENLVASWRLERQGMTPT